MSLLYEFELAGLPAVFFAHAAVQLLLSPLQLHAVTRGCTSDACRACGREDVVSELDNCKALAETYYAESGDLYRLVGVLQGCDIFWSKESK